MIRKIIKINEDLCDGCGDCVTDCAEGALKVINGKAKLMKEDFCDGLGACIGACPTGALTIEEKDVAAFDEEAVKKNLEAEKKTQPPQPAPFTKPAFGGCPGHQARDLKQNKPATAASTAGGPEQVIPSELAQWPIQLHLVNPATPLFKNKEMVLLSTCSPIASPDVHWRYIKGRSVVVACPKLDRTEPYVAKLANIFKEATIPKVHVVIMEVPCCNGLSQIAQQALKMCGRKDLVLEQHTISLDGRLLDSKAVGDT